MQGTILPLRRLPSRKKALGKYLVHDMEIKTAVLLFIHSDVGQLIWICKESLLAVLVYRLLLLLLLLLPPSSSSSSSYSSSSSSYYYYHYYYYCRLGEMFMTRCVRTGPCSIQHAGLHVSHLGEPSEEMFRFSRQTQNAFLSGDDQHGGPRNGFVANKSHERISYFLDSGTGSDLYNEV